MRDEPNAGETLPLPADYSAGFPDPVVLPTDDSTTVTIPVPEVDPTVPPDDGISDGSLRPVDPVYPTVPDTGRCDSYASGYADGYAAGYQYAAEKYDTDFTDGAALTFSYADLALLGVGFLALAIPLGILLTRTERSAWKRRWN